MRTSVCNRPECTAAAFAIVATLYFWWENIKGIPESSEKALWIMQLTTVMVVALIGWCGYTLLFVAAICRRFLCPRNIILDKHSLGWLYGSRIPQMLRLRCGLYRASGIPCWP